MKITNQNHHEAATHHAQRRAIEAGIFTLMTHYAPTLEFQRVFKSPILDNVDFEYLTQFLEEAAALDETTASHVANQTYLAQLHAEYQTTKKR